MTPGVVIAYILGVFFVILGIRMICNKDWKRKAISEWSGLPQTTAIITGTISMGTSSDYKGYCYEAEILIDGVKYRARSWDRFHQKRACANGEELVVAYKPIPDNKLLDTIMDTMTEALLNEDWEESKPRYYFKIMDEKKYLNEEKGLSQFGNYFFIGFGLLIMLIATLAVFGIIES
ncbi:MAG: hypothetical protein IJW18_09780 [Lachnospiraceae bacterium]|nr:hypothetical protein [Lachnospiraceae bacterium]